MNVLIEDMDIPNDCTNCNFCKDDICLVLERKLRNDQLLTRSACPLIEVPTSYTEPKKGKWVEPTPEGGFTYDAKACSKCSECGKKEFLGWRKNFCPNCGAMMKGNNDD